MPDPTAPFPRILCAVDERETSAVAVRQAIAVAGGDAQIVFAAAWYGAGTIERAATLDEQDRDPAELAVETAREAGVEASAQYFHAPRLGDALVSAAELHDLVVVGAHPLSRTTGIILGETASLLVRGSPLPVLVARDLPLDVGIDVATRGVPADRPAVTAAAWLAAQLRAELTLVHVPGRDEARRQGELKAQRASVRKMLDRHVEYVSVDGPPARTLVDVAEGDGAGLVVVGSEGKQGLPALRSVSERVAHLAPCSVLVMRNGG